MTILAASQLTLGYEGATIVQELDLAIETGTITVLVGPNGCGKSTLLQGLARLLRPRGGAVYLDGAAIARQPTRLVARQLAILPQSPSAPEGLTVRALVAQGRYPHHGFLRQRSADDTRIVAQVLERTGLVSLADRAVDTLSGGQRQRAWIAMALAQDTPVLLLDEPTTYLDIAHQLEVLDLLRRLNREEGRTMVMVLHDLNLATRYADRLVALKDGRIIAAGSPWDVVTPETLRAVFGVEAAIVPDPTSGGPLCVPYGLTGIALPNATLADAENGRNYAYADR